MERKDLVFLAEMMREAERELPDAPPELLRAVGQLAPVEEMALPRAAAILLNHYVRIHSQEVAMI